MNTLWLVLVGGCFLFAGSFILGSAPMFADFLAGMFFLTLGVLFGIVAVLSLKRKKEIR